MLSLRHGSTRDHSVATSDERLLDSLGNTHSQVKIESWFGRLGRSVRTCLVRTGNGLVPSGPIYRTDGPTTPLAALSAPCKENISSEPFFVSAMTTADWLVTARCPRVTPSMPCNLPGWAASPVFGCFLALMGSVAVRIANRPHDPCYGKPTTSQSKSTFCVLLHPARFAIVDQTENTSLVWV